MLRIYDEREWRHRRRLILLTVFISGSLFGSLMMNTTPAGSNALVQNPLPAKPPTADSGCGGHGGLKLACTLKSAP